MADTIYSYLTDGMLLLKRLLSAGFSGIRGQMQFYYGPPQPMYMPPNPTVWFLEPPYLYILLIGVPFVFISVLVIGIWYLLKSKTTGKKSDDSKK